MKILILTKYAVKGPSSRYRFLQYLPALTEAGLSFEVFPFFDDAYLHGLFGGKRVGWPYLARRFAGRFARVLRGRRFDLAWIEGELMPYLPGWLERWLHPLLPRRRVYDFDDAIWLRYAGTRCLRAKFASTLRSAAGVVAGNAYLERYVRNLNARTLLLPTVVDWRKYADARPAPASNVIGWIGSPSTVHYLDPVLPALRELGEKYPIELKVVGAELQPQGVRTTCLAWSEAREVEDIASFAVGIMPLTDDPFSRGKCGLKLIQYLATGVPGVASPVGVNRDIIASSGGGYLAASKDDWVASLDRLLGDTGHRRELGERGRAWVRDRVTCQARAPELIRFLRSAGAI